MTRQQTNSVNEAIRCIKQAREWLDSAMYSDEMPEEEFNKVREAYDLICEANDRL